MHFAGGKVELAVVVVDVGVEPPFGMHIGVCPQMLPKLRKVSAVKIEPSCNPNMLSIESQRWPFFR